MYLFIAFAVLLSAVVGFAAHAAFLEDARYGQNPKVSRSQAIAVALLVGLLTLVGYILFHAVAAVLS